MKHHIERRSGDKDDGELTTDADTPKFEVRKCGNAPKMACYFTGSLSNRNRVDPLDRITLKRSRLCQFPGEVPVTQILLR
jgi:hypothetical protein